MSRAEITREPIAAYHARDCIGHSRLEIFRNPDRGRERFHGMFVAKTIPAKAPTSAMDFGQALDSLVLEKKRIFKPHPATYMGKESQKKDAPMVEKPWNWNATACQEWREQNAEHIILSPFADDIESALNVDACNDAVWANPTAAALLSKGEPQLSIRYNFGAFTVQVRPDWRNTEGVTLPNGMRLGHYHVDLKSAVDERQFEANRYKFGYDRQAALYSELDRMATAELAGVAYDDVPPIPFFFAVVYKTAPVQCVVRVLEKRDLEDAHAQVRADLAAVKQCYVTGQWGTTRTGIEILPSLNWAREKATERGEYEPEAACLPAA